MGRFLGENIKSSAWNLPIVMEMVFTRKWVFEGIQVKVEGRGVLVAIGLA